ncbi:MAG: alginate lyase family protein [Planctomycetota bacterium]|nr:MAG: alginate lyase family protein [Planctomycetota bacterium]
MYKIIFCTVFMLSINANLSDAAILEMGKLSPYYENLAFPEHGTRITSPADSAPDFDIRSILDPVTYPGPKKNGFFQFADIEQNEIFTIDFGRILTSGIAVIRTHPSYGEVYGDPDNRRPRQIIIKASADGREGNWQILRSCIGLDNVPRLQSVVWEDKPIHYLRFDFGRNTVKIGTQTADVQVFPRFKFPSMSERLHDLDKLLKQDVEQLEPFRKALANHDYDRAVEVLRAYFADSLNTIEKRDYDKNYLPDDWKKNIVRFNERSWKIPGDRFDWYYYPCELSAEPPSYWLAGRQFWTVANYYQDTKDKKYIDYAKNMIRQWLADMPCPGIHYMPARNGGYLIEGWPTIRTANRTYGLVYALETFAPHRRIFDDDTWIQLLYAIWEHAQFLEYYTPSLGGNWLTWTNERLLITAKWFPEFRHQQSWLETSRRSFERMVMQDVSRDGKECEDTTYYCLRAIGEVINTYEIFEQYGVDLSPKVKSRVRNALDFPAWVHQPDFRNPAIGDMGMNGSPEDSIPLVRKYASKWGRQDLMYINSLGRVGIKPGKASRAFLDDGWFVMRSYWDDGLDARHLIFRAPPKHCRGHGHLDVLAIVLYAYGRSLLIDPGMTLYGIKGSGDYGKTNMHNTVTIDDRTQKHGPGKVNRWENTPSHDFADAEHSLYKDVIHRRRVIFVKPDYYVIIDDLTGEGERKLDWNYHFFKGADPSLSGKIVRTNFPTGGNLAILPITQEKISNSNRKPFKYVTPEIEGGKEVPSIGWLIRMKSRLPQQLVTVLFPFKGKEMPSDLQARMTESNILTVQYNKRTDVIVWRPEEPKDIWIIHHDGRTIQVNTSAVILRDDKMQ